MLKMHLKDGTTRFVRELVGGGQEVALMGQEDAYEVHYMDENDEFQATPQSKIAWVLDEDGNEVHFGNEWFPGHPDYDAKKRSVK